jgi:hypothetical protein
VKWHTVATRFVTCEEWVNNPGSVMSRKCYRKATRVVNGKPVCAWHKDGRIFRERT